MVEQKWNRHLCARRFAESRRKLDRMCELLSLDDMGLNGADLTTPCIEEDEYDERSAPGCDMGAVAVFAGFHRALPLPLYIKSHARPRHNYHRPLSDLS